MRRLGASTGAAIAVLVALFAPSSASAADIDELRARAQKAADSVTALERELKDLEERRAEAIAEIDSATQQLGTLELSLDSAQEALTAAHDRIVARAIEAYKSGPSSQLALLLSTETISDLQDVAALTDHAISVDAEDVAELTQQRDALQGTQDEVDEHKQNMMALERAAEEVEAAIRASLDDRRAELASLTTEIEELEEQARREAEAAAAAARIPVGQALLDILIGSGPAPGIPDGFATTGVSFEGLASWYGPGFEGNLTASGDVFDSNLFTAASKELPLGTWLYVSYEGRGVVVYVNDRGPYVGERILDLSRAAAAAIGLEGPGVGWVTAEIILKTD